MNRIKLSKFAFEEEYPISDLIIFLNKNGYNKKEDPNELISEDEIQFIKNNFNSYINQKDGGYGDYKKQFLKKISLTRNVNTPVQLKIIEAASKEKLLVERIIGFTDVDWEFLIATFNGNVSQPVPFSVIDEILCDLLYVENLSKNEIGDILGLNVINDPAECAIIDKSIISLENENIIESSQQSYQLTEIGKEYARNGVKYSYFNREFTIYFDLTGRNQQYAKKELKKLKSQKLYTNISEVPANIEQIKDFAIHQAPEVHFPENNFILQSASLVKAERFIAKLWVVFLENFKENKNRVLVYDENQNKILEQLSTDLNKREDLKKILFEKLVQNTDELSVTEDVKSTEQLNEETQLIEKQSLLDIAEKTDNSIEVQKLKTEIKTQKRSFNSIEFELELKEIFEESNQELWFISPWLRYHAIKYRFNYFEQQLRLGAKIFIVYSEPENETSVMVDPKAKELLEKLENKYQNFYIHQLPKFHYKNVWIRNSATPNILYTGSFNILSFYVDTNSKNYRQEQMVKIDWDDDTENMYKNFIEQFGKKYIMKEGKTFNSLLENVPDIINNDFLNKIKTVDNIKLDTFRNIGFENFDRTLNELDDRKNEALQQYGKYIFKKDLNNLKSQVYKHDKIKISRDKKKSIIDEFERLIQDYHYLNDTFSNDLAELRKSIAKLKT